MGGQAMTARAQLALLKYTAYPQKQPHWFSHLLICWIHVPAHAIQTPTL